MNQGPPPASTSKLVFTAELTDSSGQTTRLAVKPCPKNLAKTCVTLSAPSLPSHWKDWFAGYIFGKTIRKDLAILIGKGKTNPPLGWTFASGFPARWENPDLDDSTQPDLEVLRIEFDSVAPVSGKQ